MFGVYGRAKCCFHLDPYTVVAIFLTVWTPKIEMRVETFRSDTVSGDTAGGRDDTYL